MTQERLSGWGGYPVLDCRVENFRGARSLRRLFAAGGTLIARGAGHAYNDAALNPALTLSMLGRNRIGAFDPESGLLDCEAGVLLADILRAFAPRGWLPPVVPGTRFATVGGMIAADAHGRNHPARGSFGAHVESLVLATPDGEIHECGRASRPDLFRATLGGMGLTGAILSARLRLEPVETAFVAEETLAARGLDEALALLEASAAWPYRAAWLDWAARGAAFGRALVTRGKPLARAELPGRFVDAPLRLRPGRRFRVPAATPPGLLNRVSIAAFNALYFRRGRARAGVRPAPLDSFLFPLDSVAEWRRLYGPRGFVQYQCALPRRESAAGLAEVMESVAASPRRPFLAVLKPLGPEGEGLLSFPMEGHTLALDFPARGDTMALFDSLDALVHARGGRVYLAKDVSCAPERIRQGYPRLDAFLDVRAGIRSGVASALSARLDI